MKTSTQYVIPYLGLANGAHTYHFDLDDKFFSLFEKSNKVEGQYSVDIIFNKQDRTIVLEIKCDGAVKHPCDRCLAIVDFPVVFEESAIIKMMDAPERQEDEVYYLNPDESLVDISTMIYEAIQLHHPLTYVRECEAEDYAQCDSTVLNHLFNEDEKENEKPTRRLLYLKWPSVKPQERRTCITEPIGMKVACTIKVK